MPGVKTNEMPGTRAVLRHYRMSAYKARQVLDLVRGQDVDRAEEILHTTPRDGARVVAKVLASAVANARNNEQLDPEELYVAACYADEGTTLKRWRPRARGRATRIRKRSCHITVIVSRLPEGRLERKRARLAAATTAMRSRRVAASRRGRRPGEEAVPDDEATPAAADEVAAEDELEATGDAALEDAALEDAVPEDAGDEPDAQDGGAAEAVTEGDATAVAVDAEQASTLEEEATGTASTEVATERTEVETEPDAEAAPAPRARRARTAKKSTKKAPADDAPDGSGSDQDEKD